jgi:hypothetical protein
MRSSSLLAVVTAVVVVAAAALPARAQVAVVTTLPEPDPGQRDVAAGIVAVAAERWQLLSPPLDPDVTAACKTDTACMLTAARARGASHLLVVGVAGVGRRDHVVALQVLDAGGRVLFDNTAIVPGGGAPVDVGTTAAAVLARVDGPPQAAPRPAKDAPIAAAHLPATSTTALTAAGVSLIVAGALTATTTALLPTVGAVEGDQALTVAAGGAVAAAALGVAGVVCVLVDG